jgi:glycosyltransferase involved in cell wall biosynthesis
MKKSKDLRIIQDKLTILRVGTYPTKERRGMGYHSYKIGNQIGFNTIFMTPKDNGQRLPEMKGVSLVEQDFYMVSRPKSAKLHTRISFFLKRLFSIFIFSFQGIILFHKNHCEIVHIHSPMFILIALYAKLMRKRAYITFHGTDFYRIENSKLYKFFGRFLDGAFAISPAMIKKLKSVHGDNSVKQVFNGVDHDIFSNKNKYRNRSFLAVGTLKEEKGFDILIEAFKVFLDSSSANKDFTLKIAGDGPLRKTLQGIINRNNLNANIEILGHVDTEKLVLLYNESEIFVLSSISEGFPKVLLEAASCGCKIVATDVGSISEIFEDYPLICKPNNKQALADALLSSVITSYCKLDGSYQNALNKYTWHNVSAAYFKVYMEY